MIGWGTVPVVAVVVVAAADTTIDPITALNYGVFGVLVVLLVTGKWVVTRRELDAANAATVAAIAERNLERQARNDLELTVRDKYVPALEAARVSGESMLQFLRSAGLGTNG